jgi:uncharacterized protein YecE (DUF72 family)
VERLFIGTASWTIPKAYQEFFPSEGTHLERYAKTLTGVEINSSFYKDHKAITYERWMHAVPKEFRFAVKLSRVFTHDMKLQLRGTPLAQHLMAVQHLGEKLGVILIQLPPSLVFERRDAAPFLTDLRKYYEGPLVIEPRHTSWLGEDALPLWRDLHISKVIADPDPCKAEGDEQLQFGAAMYFRWHGSPQMYKSNYGPPELAELQQRIYKNADKFKCVWCIFDNTTLDYAIPNALKLKKMTDTPRFDDSFAPMY